MPFFVLFSSSSKSSRPISPRFDSCSGRLRLVRIARDIVGYTGLLFIVLVTLTLPSVAQNVTTEQYGNSRIGVQNHENAFTPANVSSSTFGKLFSLNVAGHVYAEPLYMSGLMMADGATHNVLFVATEQDNVYAFDADGHNPSQGYLWMKALQDSGETWVSKYDLGSGNISPDIGITGTPVIDPATNTLYVVAESKTTSGTIQFFSRLHALNLVDGSEKLNGPTTIKGVVPGTGDGGTTVSFSALLGNQRPGLLLAATPNGNSAASVFIAWASNGDLGPYHGWVIGYNAADISQQTGIWCDTPNGLRGGIWMPGSGLSSDDLGDVFGADGNGTFDGSTGGSDFGDSAFALTVNGSAISQTGSFTPTEQSNLNLKDYDMGSSGMMLLPTQSGSTPHLAVVVDKLGTLFLLNRDNLGGYTTPGEASLQNFSAGFTIRDSFAFFNNMLYEAGEGGPLTAYTFDPQTERFVTTATMKSSVTFGCLNCASGGTTPTISANGSSNGIVWVLDVSARQIGPTILRAFDASNLTTELYDSTQAANSRDTAGVAIAFTSPVVANGHVYVGGVNSVTAYGELDRTEKVTINAVPTTIAVGGSSSLTVVANNVTQVTVTGSDGSSYTLGVQGGTQLVTPTATTTYTATAMGSSGTVAATTTVTVDGPTVTISANPSSIGSGGSSTLNVTAANATGVIVTGSDGSSYALAATGGSQTVTPTTTTTYTATATGSSGTTTATVTVSVGVPTVSISAMPNAIVPGGTSTLSVTAGNATQVTLAGSDGSSYTLGATGGTQSATPATTTTYTATATGIGGQTSAKVTVTVAAPTVTINSNPSSIVSGGVSILNVTAANATGLTVTGNDGSSYTLAATGGSQTVTPTTTTTYTATATGSSGKATAQATVSVVAQAPKVTISVSPTSITVGGSSTLSVTATNATQVVVTGSDGSSFSLPATGGSHNVAPMATTTYTATATGTGGSASATATVTVTLQTGGCLPSGPGSVICQPTSGSTAASTVTIAAGAVAASGTIAAIRAYVDSVAVLTVMNPAKSTSFQINQAVNVAAGTHHLVIVAYESTGGALNASEYFGVGGGGSLSCYPPATGAMICSPAQSASVISPVKILAGATAGSGYITAIRVYVDNLAQTLVINSQKSKSFSIDPLLSLAKGTHYLVIVGYQSTGGAVSASESIMVQ